jgi:hypothetical protein
MLEDILRAVVRAQVGNLKRRTAGAVLEAAGLGLVGLATVFLAVGAYVWLSAHMETWLAAVLVALASLVLALLLMLIGSALMRRKSRRDEAEVMGTLHGFGLLSQKRPHGATQRDGDDRPGTSLVLAALAAGIVLGRSLKK